MSELVFKRKHKLGLKKAKAAAQQVADEMHREFDVQTSWEGHTLHFKRTGVEGRLVVTRDCVELEARLGFLLKAFRPRIEASIHNNFERYFG